MYHFRCDRRDGQQFVCFQRRQRGNLAHFLMSFKLTRDLSLQVLTLSILDLRVPGIPFEKLAGQEEVDLCVIFVTIAVKGCAT